MSGPKTDCELKNSYLLVLELQRLVLICNRSLANRGISHGRGRRRLLGLFDPLLMFQEKLVPVWFANLERRQSCGTQCVS